MPGLANVLARGPPDEAPDGNSARTMEKGAWTWSSWTSDAGFDGVQTSGVCGSASSLPVIMVMGYGSVDSAIRMQLGQPLPFQAVQQQGTHRHRVQRPERDRRRLILRNAWPKVGKWWPPHQPKLLQGRLAPAPAGKSNASRRPPPLAAGFPRGWTAWRARWCSRPRLGPRRSLYPIAYQHRGLVWAGDRLWSADWFTQTVYEQKLEGGKLVTLRSIALAGSHVSGLAVADGHLYVADSWKRTIEKRRLDGPLTLVETASSPGPSPSGLFFDGRYLWSSDLASRRLYQHDLDRDLTVLASFRSPGKTPSGLFKDSRFLWSADSDTRVIYQHRLDKELNVIAKYTMPALDQGKESLASFTWKDGDLWLARDGLSRILRRKLGQFRRISVTP